MIPALSLLFVFWLTGAARAESFFDSVSGKAILDQYESIAPEADARGRPRTLQSGFTLYGRAEPKFSEEISARFEGRVSAFRRSSERPEHGLLRGDVKDANLAWRSAGWEVRAGQVLTPWGRSDAVNPTDFLTAKDYAYFSSHEEVRKIGAPGARVSFVPKDGLSPLELTFAWNTRYPQSKLLIPRSLIPAGLSVETEPTKPAYFGSNQELALKLAYLTPGWDASLSYFDGRSHFGQFVWDGSRVRLEYFAERAIGGDFSITFNDFIVRGESAYYFYDDQNEVLRRYSLVEPNHWDSVLGVERPFGERFRALVQLLYRYHAGVKNSADYTSANPVETAVVREIGRANALIQNYPHGSILGVTFLLNYDSEDELWHAEVGGIGNFVGSGDFVLRPKISRKFMESLRLAVGMDYYGGPRDQPLGALRGYRSVFLEGTYAF